MVRTKQLLNGSGSLYSATTQYYCIQGANDPSTDPTSVRASGIISSAGIIKILRIKLSTAPGSGKTHTITLFVNGIASALTVDIFGTATTGEDIIHEVSVLPGDYVNIETKPTSSPTSSVASWVMDFVPNIEAETILLSSGLSNNVFNGSFLSIFPIPASAPESTFQLPIPCAGTFKNLYIRRNSADGTVTFTVRKNGINQSLSASLSNPSLIGNDTINSFSVVPGDLISIIKTGGTGNGVSLGLCFVPDVSGQFIIGNNQTIYSSTGYYGLTRGAGTGAEFTEQQILSSCTIKNLYFILSTAPGSGKSYTLTLRKNGVSQSLAVTIADTNTTGNAATDISVADGDLLATLRTPSGSPASIIGGFTYLGYIIPIESIQKTIQSDAKIKVLNNQETIESDAKIKVLNNQKTILSDALISSISQKTILSDAKIKVENIQKNILSDAEIIHRIQKTILSDAKIEINYNGKFIHNTDLFIVTDTNPAQIIKVNLTNLSYIKYTIIDKLNGKDLVINHDREYLYVSLNNGYVVKVSLDDPLMQTVFYIGENKQLYSITHNPTYLTTFIADNVADESLFILDEAIYEKINTDFRTRVEEEKVINTLFSTTFGSKINTDFRTIAETESKLNTDLRFALHDYDETTLYSLTRTDFHVKIDSVELTDNDLKLDSIKIIHTVDNKSTASFILTRKHDDLNNPVEITDNNVVTIYLGTKLEFIGKIRQLNCNSESEIVEVNAESDNINTDYNIVTKELPLTTINTQLHLYDILINDVSIDNPYINGSLVIVGKNEKYWTGGTWTSILINALTFVDYATAEAYITANESNDAFYSKEPVVRNYEENPKYYKGIRVDLGQSEYERAIRYDLIVANKDKIEDGTFKFIPNYTYFWIVDVQRFDISGLIGITGGVFYNKYIGTSLAPLSADLYNIVGVEYKQQLILDNEVIDLGYYTIGEAPFKDISVKNGKYFSFPKWVDKETGLYLELGTSYDYEQYCKNIASIEYEKIKNINGDLLPISSTNIDLTIDGYLYYALKLLTRINITNTTTVDIYKTNNGFPVSIKQITIDSSMMKVNMNCDNLRSEYEQKLLDQTSPEEPAEIEGFSTLYYWKFDLPNEEDIDVGL